MFRKSLRWMILVALCTLMPYVNEDSLFSQQPSDSRKDRVLTDPPRGGDWQAALSREEFISAEGDRLLYRQLAPQQLEDGQKYPLILFLHGAGERGHDNQAQLKHGIREFVARRDRYPCFVLVPQCPHETAWVAVNWCSDEHRMPEQPSPTMALCKGLLDHALATLPIDPDRVYVTGISMGGYGTFDAATRWPELFAAAAPICGGGDNSGEAINRLKTVPLWIVHGDADRIIPVERSRRMVRALKEAQGSLKYRELPGVGHDSWTETYRDEAFYEWLFGQRRSPR